MKMKIKASRRVSFRALPDLARNNAACLLSFFLPLAVMTCIFIINGVYPFGDESFMHSDMYHQYVPFLSEMQHKLKTGESLFYSWDVGIGSNFLALYGYYMASPFNWLVLLVPDAYLIEFMTWMVALKIGLCGFTFCFYLTRHFRTKNFLLVPFAVFYALSGYLAAYNWNVMWLDCVFLFPLIALGLEALVKAGKYRLYCVSLALCILTNYYISLMVCIFLVLYFLLQLVCSRMSFAHMTRAAVRFALFSLLAGGIWCPPPALLKALRMDIYGNIEEFSEIMRDKEFSKYYRLDGEKLKKVPAPFPSDFPEAEWLKYKYYTVEGDVDDAFFCGDGAAERVARRLALIVPFNRFLNYTVDESWHGAE